jgi:hypothetical protein
MLEQPVPFIHLCLWIVEAPNDVIKFEPICIAVKVVIRQCENFVHSHNDRLPDSDVFLGKRIALAATVVFLDLNRWELSCSEAEETVMILRAAAGEISERAWNDWLRRSAGKKG